MNKRSGTSKDAADKLVRGIKRKTRKLYSAEEKIRIVLAGMRGEESIAALCRREGIAESLDNLTPADVYHGRGRTILKMREEIKKQTIRKRRLQHKAAAA